jgi:uncharacterized membrane-anchored protein
MEEKQTRKKLRSLIVILVVVIIPGLLRLINSSAFESVRSVDIVILFATGMVTGVLIVTIRSYFSLNKDDQANQ